MKYPSLDPQLFIQNRKRFIAEMEPNSIAIFHSNYQYSWNGDAMYKFKQNSDIFWLCGIDQEDSVLVLYPDCPIPEYRECLFLMETNAHIATWEGHKYTKAEATETSGIPNVYWNNDYMARIRPLMNMADNVYLPLNENDRYSPKSPYKNLDFARELQAMYPLHNYLRAGKILQRLRSLKTEAELKVMREAVNISKKGWERVLNFVKPGVWEFEIEAELIHEFISNRGNGFSFDPIVASGPSACVLHYIENNKQVKDGHLILIDCGVDYANYASDMTRCLPANGTFTPRQKEVYNAVLKVMKQARQKLVPGTMLMEYQKEVEGLMTDELLALGLLTAEDVKNQDPAWPAVKKYFMHGTSHFLGVDVHDSGMRYEPMQAGMTFSCEPGIYIQEEGIGVRIENEILVTDHGPIDLMDEVNMPIEVEDIESIMKSGK
ncbi:M24 family metallopeptidase [bacterium]|nr:M24 family metallopeptidase [bacterium]